MAIANGSSPALLPSVNQYDVNKYIVSPLFMGDDYMQYMDLMPNIKGVTKIDHFGKLDKSTLAFNNGAFSSSNTTPFSAVTLTPGRLEMEHEFRAHELFGKIKGQLMRSNVDFDNIEGTVVKTALLDIIGRAAKADFNRQLWLGSTHTAAGAHSADVNYNIYDGIFKSAKAASATQITAGDVADVDDGAALNASGDAYNILKALYDAADPALLEQDMVFFVSGDIADFYAQYLESTGYAAAGYGALTQGAPMQFRGIPVIVRRDWDKYIKADSTNETTGSAADGVSPVNGAGNTASAKLNTHRAILTCRNAFVVGTDFSETQVEQWYSMDNKSYRFRVSYMVGTALSDANLAVVYTPAALI